MGSPPFHIPQICPSASTLLHMYHPPHSFNLLSMCHPHSTLDLLCIITLLLPLPSHIFFTQFSQCDMQFMVCAGTDGLTPTT